MNYRNVAIGTLAGCLLSTVALAEWSANIGYSSEYIFRGIPQKNSSASAGLDYEKDGFYVGTWGADVGDGLEVDGYFGFGGDAGEFGYSLGYTGYFYTGDFDDTYQEINLGGSYGPFTLDVAVGRYDNFGGPTQDYSHFALGLAHKGFFGTVGGFGNDFAGEYLELGYSTSVSEVDVTVAVVLSNDDLLGPGADDENVYFRIGKSFDF